MVLIVTFEKSTPCACAAPAQATADAASATMASRCAMRFMSSSLNAPAAAGLQFVLASQLPQEQTPTIRIRILPRDGRPLRGFSLSRRPDRRTRRRPLQLAADQAIGRIGA